MLKKIINERILLLDGAMGTALQDLNLGPDDFGSEALEGCNEILVRTRREAIRKIHEDYFDAGADIVSTDTFGGIRHVLDEYDLGDQTLELNCTAAKIAREAADAKSTPKRPRFVAGSLGPGTKTITVTGGITFDEVRRNYNEATRGLLDGGVDLLLLETQQDTLNIKASLLGFQDAFDKAGRSVPIILSVSIETMGTMLGGQTADALCYSVEHFDLYSLGLNCATGPDFMTDHLRTISEIARVPVTCYPNAGLPDENGLYNETPEMIAAKMERFAKSGWVNIAGGCCGTTPDHIRAIAKVLETVPCRTVVSERNSTVSGLESLSLNEDRRPILVGERTNVIGSKKFKRLIVEGKLEEGAEIGRKQVRNGAHVLDVCLANPDRDETTDMTQFLEILTKKIKAPLMIDTTDAGVLEEALKRSPGKAIINSINLEDGEERFEIVMPLVRQYGAAVIVGTIDEDKKAGMGVTRERKLEIAVRSHKLLTEKYGLAEEDIIFDPLVFPCATGDVNYYGSAGATIEGIRAIKKALPKCNTVLGISNVSFGLPPAGREVLNSVFLHHCVEAGLDLAMVNTQKLARYASIPDEEKELSDKLLFWKGPGDPAHPEKFDAVAEFAAHFRDKKPQVVSIEERAKLPIDERLAGNVVEGSKEGLLEDLDILIHKEKRKPLQIINGPLMKGMDEVGRLFGNNELIVAEVLQSAEVMKAAVAHIEPFMDHEDMASKGKVLLATVKGDVHDIGKNLVHIILKNNGFDIVDLGIKIAPAELIKAVKETTPHVIGLSGLLVKSAQQMIVTADDLKAAGIKIPILVGGAALTPKFTAARIAPRYGQPVLYAKDAMQGLDLANRLQDPEVRDSLLEENKARQRDLAASMNGNVVKTAPAPRVAPKQLDYSHNIPSPPDLKRHILDDFELEKIFDYINPIMLFGRHLGLKGNPNELLKSGDPKAVDLFKHVRALQDEILEKNLFKPRGVAQFLVAQGDGHNVSLWGNRNDFRDGKDPLEIFTFPRQTTGDGLCLADFVLPKQYKEVDYVAAFVVTCGDGVRELSEKLRDEGEYLKSHALQAIAIESAEAFAELLHEKLRQMWGIPDAGDMTIKQKFQARYRGVRVSPGYPACPDLADQKKIFKLLQPEEIGVELTEGYMMDPEASVSALVFHHPQGRYFAVGDTSAELAESRRATA
ncbi:MAG: methionine synthase [Elusimicrobia bacterium]|nr:MAG: methionine synthase [Elusimicrobiota bacterium]